MKRVRLTVFAMVLSLSVTSLVAEEIQMSCKPIASTTNGPRRMPSNSSPVLSAFYSENVGLLAFTYSIPNTSFTYNIYDEDGEIVFLGGGLFTEAGDWNAYIGLLTSGYYSIEVFIDSNVYFGELIL